MSHEALLSDLPKMTIEFFAVFSRFECALKRAGFLKRGRKDAAEADWDKFAQELDGRSGNRFLDRVPDSELRKKPPKRQIVTADGALDFGQACTIRSTTDLFVAVRRVRNNLFHGGKYPSGPVDDAERNEKLLRAAIGVLDLALEACPCVSKCFQEGLR